MELSIAYNPITRKKSQEAKLGKRKVENVPKSDEESFEPEYHQIKKMGFKPNKSKITIGEWNYQENQVYLQFMIDNFTDFATEKNRRKTKVFYRLSKILKKRTPDQCRSHHQKLQLKFKDDLCAIIGQVHRKIQKSIAQEYVDYQHRLHLESMEKYKELNRTGPEEEVAHGEEMMEEEWFAVVQRDNLFRVIIREENIASWQQSH